MFNTQKFLKSIRSASVVALPCEAWITKHSMTRDKRGGNSTLINVRSTWTACPTISGGLV